MIATVSPGGLVDAQGICSDQFLKIDVLTLLDDGGTPSADCSLPAMNESLPNVTVQLFQFTEGLDPTGIALSCSLDCTPAGTNSVVLGVTPCIGPVPPA